MPSLKSWGVALAVAAMPIVMGNTGCDDNGVPSTVQINYHVPVALRNCPYAPRSPGRKSTSRQRAAYISGLYHAWKRCHGNLAQRDALYAKYRFRIEAFQGTDN